MNVQRVLTLVTITTLALAGCGGGGGGVTAMPGPQQPGNGGGGSPQLTESQLYGSIEKYREVAANAPALGSITQSSNGNNGISTDRVDTMLQGGDLTVIVKDGSGNVSLELDSSQHEHTNLNGTAWMDDGDSDFPQGWSGNGWVLSKQDEEDVVVSVAYALWEDTDDTNYLAGGYWIKGNEDDGVTEMGSFGDAGEGSIFSYYDGSDSSWQRPVTGTATYLGEAEGAYVNPDGDAGVWWSLLRLDANFSNNSITGCVGCRQAAAPTDNPNETGIYTYTTIDDLKNDNWTFNDLYVSLDGQNNINNDGGFEGTLKLFELNANNELASTGKWGGLFSENSNASTSPSTLVGSLGGTTSQGHGFIGVFHGQK